MPSLKERLSDTIKVAMKAGDKSTLGFARGLHAAVRKKEIDDRVDLDDAGIMKIVQTLVKQRMDSIEQFKSGGRADLVAQEEAEMAFLQTFLPAQLSDAELGSLVEAAISESQAATAKDIGKVMKILLPKIQGRADGKRVNQFIQERLKG